MSSPPRRTSEGRRAISSPRKCARAPSRARRLRAALGRLKGAISRWFSVRRRTRSADRREARLASRGGFGATTAFILAPTALALAPFAKEIRLSRRRTIGVTLTREKDHLLRRRRRIVETRPATVAAGSLMVEQGQLPPLHGQGNPRTARGGRAHAAHYLDLASGTARAAVRPRFRRKGAVAAVTIFGLRDRLLRPGSFARYWLERFGAAFGGKSTSPRSFRYREAPPARGRG